MTRPSVNFVRAETDLFNEPGYDLTLQNSLRVEYHPITNITDKSAPVTFFIQGNDSQYIDFSESQLYVRLKITDSKGADLAAGIDPIAPINNFLHSMFQQVSVHLNETQITPPTSHYPFKSFIETLLSYGKEYRKTQAMAALYTKEKKPDTTDAGYLVRAGLVEQSAVFEVYGRLNVDFFNQTRYLVPGIDVKITLDRATDQFCLYTVAVAAGTPVINAQVHIVEAKLIVQKHALLPSIALAHIKLLEQGHPVCYPMRKGEIKTFSLPRGTYQYTNETLINGLLPDRLILAFVRSSAVHGSYGENPFNFINADLSNLSVTVNGEQITSLKYEVDFANKKRMEAYFSIFQGLGIANCDSGIDLTFEEYCDGKTFFVFDLRHQHDGTAVPRHGNLKIDLRLANANTTPITGIVHADYQSTLYVDKNRHIYFKDFTN